MSGRKQGHIYDELKPSQSLSSDVAYDSGALDEQRLHRAVGSASIGMQSAIRTVTEGRDLSTEEMTAVMRTIMTGDATPAQIGGVLIGLRMKGETIDEITAAASVMREYATPVRPRGQPLVDTCGTGGDTAGTFNISTASAFVVAAAGAYVAKHGNRSVSSKSGSADVLEAAGVNLALDPKQVARCIDKVGVGFMFAPQYHGATKHAIGPRREMAVRTIFNLLGPLTNPAGAPRQLIGVFSKEWVGPMAEVLVRLGSRHVMVVYADDGLDEISIGSATTVAEYRAGEIKSYTITPEEFGLKRADIKAIRVGGADESLTMIRAVLAGEAGPGRDIVALNAGAAIYVAGLAPSLGDGLVKALEILTNGRAAAKLDALVDFSRRIGVRRLRC